MSLKHFLLPMTLAVTLAAGAAPANAQHRNGGREGGGQADRGQSRHGQSRHGQSGGGQSRGGRSGDQSGGGRSDGRSDAGRPASGRSASGHVQRGGRAYDRPHVAQYPRGRVDRRAVAPYRHGGRVIVRRPYVHRPFVHRPFVHRPFVHRPFVHVRVVRPFRGPFFSFRPRHSLGFGLFAGYPVACPWGYVAPYPYPYAYGVDPSYADPSYADPPYGDPSYGVPYTVPDDYDDGAMPPEDQQPSALPDDQRDYGGMSFDISPGDAHVYVDGEDAGTVQSFSPSSAPLTLAPGRHQIVIQKPGYQTMTFSADITEGQVLPYKGTMQPQ